VVYTCARLAVCLMLLSMQKVPLSTSATRLGKDGISSAESGQYFITLISSINHLLRQDWRRTENLGVGKGMRHYLSLVCGIVVIGS